MPIQQLPGYVQVAMRRNPMLALAIMQQRQQQQQQRKPNPLVNKGVGALGGKIDKWLGLDKFGDNLGDSIDKWLGLDTLLGDPVSAARDKLSSLGTDTVIPQGLEPLEGAAPTIGGNFASLGIGPQAGITAAAALTAKGLKDIYDRKEGDPLSRGVTAMSTFGFSELGRLAGLGQKSTKEYQKERREDVVNSGNRGWADFYRRNPIGAHDDAKRDWKLADGSWDPREYEGVMGHAEAFGDDWFHRPTELKHEFIKQAKDEGLYSHDKGNILFSGKKGHLDRARELYDEIMNQKEEQENQLEQFKEAFNNNQVVGL